MKITDDYGKRASLNTVVSTCMEMLNSINQSIQSNSVSTIAIFDAYKVLISLLMPITPHICEELFKNLGLAYDNTCVTWPKANKDFIKDDNMLIIIQINGKVRKKIDVKSNTSQEKIEKYVLSLEDIKKYTNSKEIKKIIYIKEKLVNIVVE